jgi:hypothetical protein
MKKRQSESGYHYNNYKLWANRGRGYNNGQEKKEKKNSKEERGSYEKKRKIEEAKAKAEVDATTV